jgi:hypothetical protein
MIEHSLFAADDLETCLQRIEGLTADTKPQWGSMSAAQMLAHCAEVQEVANGKDLVGTPFFVEIIARVIRDMVVSDKPYPRNSRTHPQYVQHQEQDFELEKLRLLAALDSFVDAGPTEGRHPLFGRMSADERGWSCHKHLDHHLTQFGV